MIGHYDKNNTSLQLGFLKQFDNDHLRRGEHTEHVGFELSMLFTDFCVPQTGAIQRGNNQNLLDYFPCHIWGREGMGWRRRCLVCLRLLLFFSFKA